MTPAARVVALRVMPGSYAICRLGAKDEVPRWALHGTFVSITRTPEELSVVCDAGAVPQGVKRADGWRALAVRGPLPFGETGILAGLAAPLAEAGISLFALSTYDTDYLLVREPDLAAAVAALRKAGHSVAEDPDRLPGMG